jgi:hypothetical protein
MTVMKKAGILIALLLAAASLSAQSAKHVHRIYVDELHFPSHPDLDAFVRSKLISSLAQDCASSCTVMDGPSGEGEDTADAVLTGALMIQTTDNLHFSVQGAMRLVDKNGTVIWAATIYSSALARSATSSFAEHTAKNLTTFLAAHQ